MPSDLPPRRRHPPIDLDHPAVVAEVRAMFWLGFMLGLGSWAMLTAVLLAWGS